MDGYNNQQSNQPNSYNQGQPQGFNYQNMPEQPQGFNYQSGAGQPQGFNYNADYNNAPTQGFTPPPQQPYGNLPPIDKNPTLIRDIILSLVQGFALSMWITAIISFIFTLTANDKFISRRYLEYEKNTKYARIARIVGYVIFTICVIFFIVASGMLAWTMKTMG